MEQVIFLHADEEGEETLNQMQHSLAQRLVLVAPAHMDRLRLSLLLRLARRYLIAQAKEVYLVSEDRLAQMLAARMGFAVAATLDEYRGLTPGPATHSRKRTTRPSARLVFPPAPPPASAAPSQQETAAPSLAGGQTAAPPEKPAANLEKMLVDGYLPNPAATPDLEEEAERAEREEYERLHYEIDEEQQPSRAQQEAESHEERIISRILRTSQPDLLPPDGGTEGQAEDDLPALPPRPAEQRTDTPRPPEDRAARDELPGKGLEGSLRPMHTIDELLRERGRAEVFEWFEHQSTQTAKTGSAARSATGLATATPPPEISAPPAPLPESVGRQSTRTAQVVKPTRPRKRIQLRPPGTATWRRAGVIVALALSVLMMGTGLALIPSAEVDYHEEISPYNEALLLDAHPAGFPPWTGAKGAGQARAEMARFDGILTAQALATGQRTAPNAPDHLLAVPTQDDANQAASQLRAQLQQWGEKALHAQAGQGDILGPMLSDEETMAFPAVGTSLPAGVSHFQVSVSLHLRATLVLRAALLQAAMQQLRLDVNRKKPGFAPQPAPALKLNILGVTPAGPGDQRLDLLVRVQTAATIGPALTPEQVRSAIAGWDVPAAEAYLNHQPGITAASISIQPKWLNRLPIFSARIRINLES
ncbi:MAG TPA: hypothetical protein VKT82_14190 [Ktedonobacterales bacterium]|nr:hypothetical protein [Ktedonobacterales bacterium]